MRLNQTAVLAVVARVRGHDYTEGFAWAWFAPYETLDEMPAFGQCEDNNTWPALVREHVADFEHVSIVVCDGGLPLLPHDTGVWFAEPPKTLRVVRERLKLRPRETWSAWVERTYGVPLVPDDQARACALVLWARKSIRTTGHVQPQRSKGRRR